MKWLLVIPFIFISATALAATEPEKPQPTLTKVEVTNTVKTQDASGPKPIEAKCEPGDDLRSSDLCAQWAAVDQAKRNVEIANNTFWAGTIINVVTLFGIMLTFIETRRAANLAFKALTQERALIQSNFFCEAYRLENGEYKVRIKTDWTNVGHRPALGVWGIARIDQRPAASEFYHAIGSFGAGSQVDVLQSGETHKNIFITENTFNIEDLKRDVNELRVSIYVKYYDRLDIDWPLGFEHYFGIFSIVPNDGAQQGYTLVITPQKIHNFPTTGHFYDGTARRIKNVYYRLVHKFKK